jgi:hypothetical protein
MKRNGWSISITAGVLMPSFVTLGFLVIFGVLAFFWLMGGKTPTEIAVAAAVLALRTSA